MGKGIKKGFFNYLLIFLGIIIAGFIICAVIMIFSPGTQILGFSYFNYNETKYILEADSFASSDAESSSKIELNNKLEMIDINNFIINTDGMNVEIVKKSSDWSGVQKALNIQLGLNLRGFVRGKNNELKISSKFFQDTKTLEITINSPEAFLSLGNLSELLIELPSSLKDNKTFEINTTSGNVNLGGNGTSLNKPQTLKCSKIGITSTSGSVFTSDYFTLDGKNFDSYVKTTSGALTFSKPLFANNFTFETKTGNATFSNENFNLTNDFNLKADMSFVHINKISAKNLNLVNTNGKIYADTVSGNIIFSEDSANCDIQLKDLNGSILIGEKNKENITQTTTVSVSGTLNGEANIFTKGNIKINELRGETNIKAEGNSIEIVKIDAPLNITHKNSKIILGKLTENNELLSKEINDKINIIGQNSVIESYFENIIDGSKIENSNGKITLYLDSPVKLDITAKSVKINGEDQTLTDSSIEHIFQSGTNTLTITNTNGSVEIYEE